MHPAALHPVFHLKRIVFVGNLVGAWLSVAACAVLPGAAALSL